MAWIRFASGLRSGAIATITALAGAAACSAGSANVGSEDPASGGAGATSTGADMFVGGGGQGGRGSGGGCAGVTVKVDPLPLDIYMVLDKSGSMRDEVGPVTRWDLVVSAVKAYLGSGVTDVSFGFQFFPLYGPDPAPGTMVCETWPITDPPCNVFSCEKPCDCYCLKVDSCAPGDYATPAVPIGPLASVAGPISSLLDATQPGEGTPTGAALQGALDHATAWAEAHPDHAMVVLLVTDGTPTECDPDGVPDIADMAAKAAASTPKITTFVIGVSDEPIELASLHEIALAGGSGQAFLADDVDANQKVIEALEEIRGATLACEYAFPVPDSGVADPTQVNVEATIGGQEQVVKNVANAAACDPSSGGWYYDDPQNPKKIYLCEATCAGVKAEGEGAEVRIVVGCQTLVD